MNDTVHSPEDLQQIYRARFTGKSVYRRKVWSALCSFFSQWVSPNDTVLDLGAGYCEFINTIPSGKKFAMDLNLEAKEMANSDVTVIHQDCSQPWDARSFQRKRLYLVAFAGLAASLPASLEAQTPADRPAHSRRSSSSSKRSASRSCAFMRPSRVICASRCASSHGPGRTSRPAGRRNEPWQRT